MEMPSTSIRDLAQRLLVREAESRAASDANEAELVCEKLRVSLGRFAGADGFVALARRSLALARAEVPSLKAVRVKPDGCVEGLGDPTVADDGNEAGAALITYLLFLLVTFLGESVVFRMVHEAWPEVAMEH